MLLDIDPFAAPAQVLLRWATQRGIAVIPKTNSNARLKENFTCNLFDLTNDEIAQISTLNRNLRVSESYMLQYCV
jgi:D-xylose reductase